jgi:hypothetical protein
MGGSLEHFKVFYGLQPTIVPSGHRQPPPPPQRKPSPPPNGTSEKRTTAPAPAEGKAGSQGERGTGQA